MSKKNMTRHGLLLSVISLILCCAMMVGTTMAWFTDAVSSTNNKIVAGNLDVDVYYGDPALKQSIEGVSALFADVTLWEPGAAAYENLTVANLGTLALKYQVSINFANANAVLVDGEPVFSLPQILQVGLVPGGIEDGLSREAVVEKVTTWYPMESYTWEDELLANTNEETMGVVIWWDPAAEDNNWNLNNGKTADNEADHLHVDLGITLVATQLMNESDSFGNNYDESAQYPQVASGTMEAGSTDALVLTTDRITVTVPAGSPAGYYKLDVPSLSLTVDEEDNGVLNSNFGVTKDNTAVDGIDYKVQIRVDVMAKDIKVTHKGEEIQNPEYDPFTGIVSFTTDSFSPFTVEYTLFAKEVKLDADNRKIKGGYFYGVNPATLDTSLIGGEYMAVDFVKNGEKIYAVSEASTTVILSDADDGGSSPAFENGAYEVTPIKDGELYKKISDLQNNDHSTVYLLPGTYEEGTTIYVYSSMDIIGLGERDSVKVIKTSSSKSNRHLFNCSGTKADYIQVTLRNMYLDATAKTTSKNDNAAVQSIRKSKVKCYDLNIVKGTGWDAVAFYVNGKNAVDGVEYTAYLYAENCQLNTTRTFGIVTTSGSYKFYHNGLTYNNGTAYTNNSGSIKNTQLAWNDWEW